MGEVAIVGMACLFPGAPDIRTFWRNIVAKVDAVTDPPEDWEGEPWYDPESKETDRIYAKRAGYLRDLSRFDPLAYGVFPKAIDGSEPEHWLSLKVAYDALADAGVPDIPINRERAEVIMGRGTFVNRGYATMCHHSFGIDQSLTMLKEVIPDSRDDRLKIVKEKLRACVPPFSSDTAPGLVSSIMTGRIANRLDLHGSSYSVDAACSSSLLAVEHGYYDLLSGKCDAALVGGINLGSHHPIQLLFCRLGAASRSEQVKPFDEKADGTLIGDGVGFVLLKRRDDAEKDGNRIYALIRGVGSASDGRGTSVVAPRVEGEELAIRRAYEEADIPPSTVELVEAHGTGIPLGDKTEIEALIRVFGPREAKTPHCAIGSVKSMIGHLLPAAGMAGLIKAVLSVYNKTLPPTLHCQRPDPELNLDKSVFYVNTEARPWVVGSTNAPRRAGVNAFGFGGSNAHVVLEEYPAQDESTEEDFDDCWETELIVFQGLSRDDLVTEAERVHRYLDAVPSAVLKDVAYTMNRALNGTGCRLAIVAASTEELKKKIVHTVTRLKEERSRIKDKSGIYYFDEPLGRKGKTAFLFPGEGSQYVNMLGDLCKHFPEVRYHFDLLSKARFEYPELDLYRDAIFPPPAFTDEERTVAESRLWEMDNAITGVMTANRAMLSVLEHLSIKPDAMVGHSSGELFTLSASGVSELSRGQEENIMGYLLLGHTMMERIESEQAVPDTPLITVGALGKHAIDRVVKDSGGELLIAMDNCPNQVVLCCRNKDALASYLEALKKEGAVCQLLPFSRPYHTQLFEPARKHLEELFNWGAFSPPQVTVYSCMSGRPLPDDSAELRDFGIEQWLNPVRFRETIETMYSDGVRVFLEVGPKAQLTGFVNDTLKKKECLAIASNVHYRSGITQLHHALGLLAAHGVSMDLNYLYKRRSPQQLDFDATPVNVAEDRLGAPLSLAIPMLSLKGVTTDWLTGKRPKEERVSVADGGEKKPSVAERAPVSPLLPSQEPASPPRSNDNGSDGMTVSAHQPASRQPANTVRSAVMAEYFQTMEQFLDNQQTVFHSFLGRRNPAGVSVPTTSSGVSPCEMRKSVATSTERPANASLQEDTLPLVHNLPFVERILSHTPGEEIAVFRELSLKEDIFLLDHTFGRNVAVTDKGLYGLPVMPLTLSMEIMAETGALLFPGKIFLGMKNIRAYRWITVEKGTFSLKIEAKRLGPNQARVRLRQALDKTGKSPVGMPILEAVVVFDDHYPDSPPVGEFSLTGRRPSKIRPEDIYSELMFHGPSFRGVASVDWRGAEGIESTMEVLPTDTLFSSTDDPQFVFDPVLVDAAGQLVAFFYNDDLSTGVDLYPFRVEEFQVYGPRLPNASRVLGRCRTRDIGNNQLRSDIEMIGPDGRLNMRLVGWEDRTFELPREFNRMRFKPREVFLSALWPEPVGRAGDGEEIVCCRMNDYPEALLHGHHGVWLNVLVHLSLSRPELDQWRQMSGSQNRRVEWLLGRVAAKDAVRHVLKKRYGLDLCLPDIQIGADQYRRPVAMGSWTQQVEEVPIISLSHKQGLGVAIACIGKTGCGIDVEVLDGKKKGIDHMVLSSEERETAGTVLSPADDEWLLRLWCGKEAVGKSLGRGLPAGPRDLIVRYIDAQTGVVTFEVANKLLEAFPRYKGSALRATTNRDGALISACAVRD